MAAPVSTSLGTLAFNAYQADSSTASSAHVAISVGGIVTSVRGTTYAAVTTADSAITAKLNGTTISGLTGTITVSGAGAGVVYTMTVPRSVYVQPGDNFEIVSDGAGSGTVPTMWTVEVRISGRYF